MKTYMKSKSVQAEVLAEALHLKAKLISPFPEPTYLKDKLTFECGCDRKIQFDANVASLQALNKTASDLGKAVYCSRCSSEGPRQRLNEIAADCHVTWDRGHSAATILITCSRGHTTEVNRSNFLRGWNCPKCPKLTASKEAFREITAERGYQLTRYDSRGHANEVVTPDGEEMTVSGFVFKRRPDADKIKLEGLTPTYNVYLYQNGDYGFYQLGALPRLLPFALWEHIGKSTCEVVSHHWHIGEAREDLSRIIGKSDVPKVLNVNHSVKAKNLPHYPGQWISPGVYTWGTFPRFYNTLEVQP